MHRTTRCMLQKIPGAWIDKNQFLIPSQTAIETSVCATHGVWKLVTDSQSTAMYESYIEQDVIRDTVLRQASGGHAGVVFTMSLFNNLCTSAPYFSSSNSSNSSTSTTKEATKFVKDFLQAVKPALEKYHDTFAQLVTQMHKTSMATSSSSTMKQNNDNVNTTSQTETDVNGIFYFDTSTPNVWREQAEAEEDTKDPSATSTNLAKMFSKMVTKYNFDHTYYMTKVQQSIAASSPLPFQNYIPDSAEVLDIALLNVQAVEMNHATTGEEEEEQEKSTTTDQNDNNKNSSSKESSSESPKSVAARFDVLYELKQVKRSQSNDDHPSMTTTTTKADTYGFISGGGNKSSFPRNKIRCRTSRFYRRQPSSVSNFHNSKKNTTLLSQQQKKQQNKNQKPLVMPKSSSPKSSSNSKLRTKTKPRTILQKLKQQQQQSLGKKQKSGGDSDDIPTLSQTVLAVAVFEGWIHGGPENRLRWKIAGIRDAYEFK